MNGLKGSGVRFSKLPLTFWARKAIFDAQRLPPEILFLIILKTENNILLMMIRNTPG